ncbi:peptidoglycan-binding protein [Pedobacter deserti]|uniref:peptidoglycan-binding protein n=1 Tax=Pedobacter deserti TaxID=2817382 RepID=UPI00210C927C|nr:peptidoglycan-binding protein [Pedobacter sp. SYSU D00382]
MGTVKFLSGLFCLAFVCGGWLPGSGVVAARVSEQRFLMYKKENDEERIIRIAEKEIGVREEGCENCGRRVEAYLKYVGLGKGSPWCAAYVSWVFAEAGFAHPRTAWTPALFPSGREMVNGLADIPARQEKALVYGLYYPSLGRVGHCGIVTGWQGDWVLGTEGNTNMSGARDGEGVYRKIRHQRTVAKLANWLDNAGRPQSGKRNGGKRGKI